MKTPRVLSVIFCLLLALACQKQSDKTADAKCLPSSNVKLTSISLDYSSFLWKDVQTDAPCERIQFHFILYNDGNERKRVQYYSKTSKERDNTVFEWLMEKDTIPLVSIKELDPGCSAYIHTEYPVAESFAVAVTSLRNLVDLESGRLHMSKRPILRVRNCLGADRILPVNNDELRFQLFCSDTLVEVFHNSK
jgi:hypothetical protein